MLLLSSLVLSFCSPAEGKSTSTFLRLSCVSRMCDMSYLPGDIYQVDMFADVCAVVIARDDSSVTMMFFNNVIIKYDMTYIDRYIFFSMIC